MLLNKGQMGSEDLMLIIRRNDFLDKLSRDDYDALNIVHNFIVSQKDEYIYFDAGYHNKLYFIKEGFVKIGNVDDDGNELVKEILQPGDVFGQFSLERNNMLGEFAQAHKQQSILCAFTLQDFERLLAIRPEMSIEFSKKVGRKLKRTEMRLMNLLQKDVRTRLLYFFWSMAKQHCGKDANDASIDNYLTHEDISRLTGTSRQTVTTLINQFVEEGLISLDRRNILIHDIRKLEKEARIG
jgi:CRP/FNR family transcriptional regulator, cyclic AMP receptor protein